MLNNEDFSTADIYQASALTLALKIKPDLIMHNGTVLFQFPCSDVLYRALALFGNGSMEGSLFEYSQVIKALRADMYGLKGKRL